MFKFRVLSKSGVNSNLLAVDNLQPFKFIYISRFGLVMTA
jgi:hypothetical protein